MKDRSEEICAVTIPIGAAAVLIVMFLAAVKGCEYESNEKLSRMQLEAQMARDGFDVEVSGWDGGRRFVLRAGATPEAAVQP